MAGERQGISLGQAALNGAAIGPVMILVNAYFSGQLATLDAGQILWMMMGGAAGGAFLFVGVISFARFLRRRMF
jgi:hypothetical protein